MSAIFRSPSLLRLALMVDAVGSAASGLLMVGGAGPLPDLLGLPRELLIYAGVFCVGYAAFVGFVATRDRLPYRLMPAIIVGNFAWAAASLALIEFGWLVPTALGTAFVAGQALAVFGFGLAQYFGLRQARMATA